MPEMLEYLSSEANRLDTTQDALVAIGMSAARSPTAQRRIEVCEGIIHLIEMVRADPVIMERLKKKAAVTRAAGQKDNRGSEKVSSASAGSGAG